MKQSAEIHDQYMEGYCMYLAAALNHCYKFPIGMLTITHSDGVEKLSHAWVNLPNGMCLDIRGEINLDTACSYRDEAPKLKYSVYSPTTLDNLERFSEAKLPSDDKEVREALSVAQKFLKRFLPKTS